ncbi:MAG: plastocyanin/azurin family copper-binding protein, partial [Rhodospirillales bacterium]
FSLAAGEVKEIEFVPLQAGTYAVECTKPLHGLFGMTGDIVVQ